jgi:hypothetical protein
MTSTARSFDSQVTVVVRSDVVPSENTPVAANFWLPGCGSVGLCGLTSMLHQIAAVTARVVEPVRPMNEAEILWLPAPQAGRLPLRRDCWPTAPALEPSSPAAVRSTLLPSAKEPVAWNDRRARTPMVAPAGSRR